MQTYSGCYKFARDRAALVAKRASLKLGEVRGRCSRVLTFLALSGSHEKSLQSLSRLWRSHLPLDVLHPCEAILDFSRFGFGEEPVPWGSRILQSDSGRQNPCANGLLTERNLQIVG